jgi:hypothetical protein
MPQMPAYNSVTMEVQTPDGVMFVIIMEDDDNKPIEIIAHIGKAGAPVQAWAFALAATCTKLLDCGKGINDLIELLSSITSSKAPSRLEHGVILRSGPEGFCYALMQYRADKFQQLKAQMGGDDDYRPPRMFGT